jgi:hypothetical protein
MVVSRDGLTALSVCVVCRDDRGVIVGGVRVGVLTTGALAAQFPPFAKKQRCPEAGSQRKEAARKEAVHDARLGEVVHSEQR